MRSLRTIDDKIRGPSKQFTITHIKYAGLGWDTESILNTANSPDTTTTFGAVNTVTYFDIYQLYWVIAKTDSQELFTHYGVCESRILTNPILNSEERESVREKIMEVKKNFKEILQLGLDVKLVEDILFKPKMEELTDYIGQHPTQGLTFNMRTKSDGLPSNILQKAYEALPK
jgi:hypothetical protein|tara:strand:- start:11246 stop:11764 length:519 start_codon:yes stop_codon:yes gene_type:complete